VVGFERRYEVRVIDIVVFYTLMIPVLVALVVVAFLFKPIPFVRHLAIVGIRKVNVFLGDVASERGW